MTWNLSYWCFAIQHSKQKWIMKRELKQCWSTISPISTTKNEQSPLTLTELLNQLMMKTQTYSCIIQVFILCVNVNQCSSNHTLVLIPLVLIVGGLFWCFFVPWLHVLYFTVGVLHLTTQPIVIGANHKLTMRSDGCLFV